MVVSRTVRQPVYFLQEKMRSALLLVGGVLLLHQATNCFGGSIMLEVTPKAMRHLQDVGQIPDTGSAIRIAVMGGGGPHCGLGLIIDTVKEADLIIRKGDHTIVIDKKLMEFCQNITIDFTDGEPDRCDSLSKRGFLLNTDNPLK